MRTARRAGREGAAGQARPPCACADEKPTPGDRGAGLVARLAESHVKGSRGRRR